MTLHRVARGVRLAEVVAGVREGRRRARVARALDGCPPPRNVVYGLDLSALWWEPAPAFEFDVSTDGGLLRAKILGTGELRVDPLGSRPAFKMIDLRED